MLTEDAAGGQVVYFGHFAPLAQRVSVVGPFNGWRPNATPLTPVGDDWWHVALQLPPGEHCYRFWVEYSDPATGVWRRDPENPDVVESGYMEGHSVVEIQVKH
ncbi:MAG: hypothetical protein IPK16_07435 [Anaerolineales bacterium]|nr:hypothetical protein [Anaerolineales bacterium]